MLTNILMSIFKVVMSIFKVVTQNISSVTYIYIRYVYIIFFCHVHQPIIIVSQQSKIVLIFLMCQCYEMI